MRKIEKVNLNTKINKKIYDSIKTIKLIEKIKLSEIVEFALSEYVEKYKNKKRSV